jgi:hypothetical protein
MKSIMTAPSDVRFKQRVVIEFLVTENVKTVDIHRRLLVVYGNQTLDVSSVRRWALRVKGSEVGKAPNKFKVQASAGKVMLTMFWDS